jgi:hypothetical protein
MPRKTAVLLTLLTPKVKSGAIATPTGLEKSWDSLFPGAGVYSLPFFLYLIAMEG